MLSRGEQSAFLPCTGLVKGIASELVPTRELWCLSSSRLAQNTRDDHVSVHPSINSGKAAYINNIVRYYKLLSVFVIIAVPSLVFSNADVVAGKTISADGDDWEDVVDGLDFREDYMKDVNHDFQQVSDSGHRSCRRKFFHSGRSGTRHMGMTERGETGVLDVCRSIIPIIDTSETY
jgi:hypothetical protein